MIGDTPTPNQTINDRLASTGETNNPLIEIGDSGLLRYGGFITEEWFAQAKGIRGIRLLREMTDNHPVIGAVSFAIRMLMRGTSWSIMAASDDPADVANAEFVESTMSDMVHSWQDHLDQWFTFLEQGWSMSEIVYKIRDGENEEDPTLSSQYTDKKIGIKKIALRSQDTLYKFEMDDSGNVLGMWQMPPQASGLRFIPIDRILHLRASSAKDNPLGRSILRNAMVSYLFQKKIQEIEAIGIERDLAGYPVIYAPAEIMKKDANPDQKAMLANLQKALKNIRRDSSEGIILPSNVGPNNEKLYDIKLMTSGGTRQLNPDVSISRYDQRIAMTVLADFVMIGNGSSAGGSRGSYGMAEAKQDMFSTALTAWLDAVCEEFNRQVIPRLMKLNNMKAAKLPRLVHSEVQKPNLGQLAAFITAISNAGAPLFPDNNLERWLREQAGMPEPNPDISPGGRGDTGDNINPVNIAPGDGDDPKPKPAGSGGGAAPPSGNGQAATMPGDLS